MTQLGERGDTVLHKNTEGWLDIIRKHGTYYQNSHELKPSVPQGTA